MNAASLCRRAGLALPIPQAEAEHERRSSGRWAGGVAALLVGSCLALPAAAPAQDAVRSVQAVDGALSRPAAGDRAGVALDWARANRARARAHRGRRRRSRPDRARDLARHRLHAPALPAVGPRDPGLRRRAAREPRPRRARSQRDRLAGAGGRLGGAAARRRRGAARAPARRRGGAAGRRGLGAGGRAPHDAFRGRRLRSPGAVRQRPRHAAGMAPDLPRERRRPLRRRRRRRQRRRPLPPEPRQGRGARRGLPQPPGPERLDVGRPHAVARPRRHRARGAVRARVLRL